MLLIITPPHSLPGEELIVNKLFESGLHLLHLRKPDVDRKTVEGFIRRISPCFRERVILHNHFELAEEYGLRGIHLKYQQAENFAEREEVCDVSVSCHSFERIDSRLSPPNYAFLSPVFDSISKQGYSAAFDREFCGKNCKRFPFPLSPWAGSRRKTPRSAGNWGSAG